MTDIKIYQINFDRDIKGVAYESYDRMIKLQGSSDIDASIYDIVFEGTVDVSDIEDIYYYFNHNKPNGYIGRFFSISDVVEVIESDNIKPGFYYCNNIGFKEISFDAGLAKNQERMLQAQL